MTDRNDDLLVEKIDKLCELVDEQTAELSAAILTLAMVTAAPGCDVRLIHGACLDEIDENRRRYTAGGDSEV